MISDLQSKMNYTIPENLHILGTMNTADGSIAIVDVAVRIDFVLKLWPQMKVVEDYSCETMRKHIKELYLYSLSMQVMMHLI